VYRPQTNGKMERFWKTVEHELLAEQVYDSLDHLKEELFNYMLYYNHLRYHQGINRKPFQSLSVLSSNKRTCTGIVIVKKFDDKNIPLVSGC
jgi:hypothetical protein